MESSAVGVALRGNVAVPVVRVILREGQEKVYHDAQEVSTVRGRRFVGGMGSGGTGEGGVRWEVPRSHRAQWGFFVKPSNALGALERGRLGFAGTGGVGRSGLDHVTCIMPKSHTERIRRAVSKTDTKP